MMRRVRTRLFLSFSVLALAGLLPGGAAEAVGSTWTSASGGPPARFGASMAYAPSIGRLVLFGGCAAVSTTSVTVRLLDGTDKSFTNWTWCAPGNQRNDTWLWNGATSSWTEIFPTGTLPNKRYAAAMTYDYKSDRIVLFGGLYQTDAAATQPTDSELCFQEETSDEGIAGIDYIYEPSAPRYHKYYCFSDTWTLTGSIGGSWQWQKLTTAEAPSSRFDSGMSFDGNGFPTLIGGCHRLGLIGSHGDPTVPATWDCTEYPDVEVGGNENCAIPAVPLDPLCAESHEYEVTDSWRLTWVGTPGVGTPRWDQVGCLVPTSNGLCAPPEIRGAAVTFNPHTRKILLWGGYYFEPRLSYGGFMGDTWEFDGSSWTKLMPAGMHDQWCPSLSAIKAWTSGAHVFDGTRWKVLDFGGFGKYYSASPSCDPANPQYAQSDPYYSNGAINRYANNGPRSWNDTWLWDSGNCSTSGSWKMCWQLPAVDRDSLQGPNAMGNYPPAGLTQRHGASVAFDPGSGKVVLFGGLSGTSGLSDTWVLTATPSGDPCGVTC